MLSNQEMANHDIHGQVYLGSNWDLEAEGTILISHGIFSDASTPLDVDPLIVVGLGFFFRLIGQIIHDRTVDPSRFNILQNLASDVILKINLFVEDVIFVQYTLYNPYVSRQFDVIRTIAVVTRIDCNRCILVREREVLTFDRLILMIEQQELDIKHRRNLINIRWRHISCSIRCDRNRVGTILIESVRILIHCHNIFAFQNGTDTECTIFVGFKPTW